MQHNQTTCFWRKSYLHILERSFTGETQEMVIRSKLFAKRKKRERECDSIKVLGNALVTPLLFLKVLSLL